MNTYFIFYTETKEVIALYNADTVDLDRYIVHEGPSVGHALVIDEASPYECEIAENENGNYVATPKILT